MNKNQIIKIRELHKNEFIKVYLTDVKYFDDSFEDTTFVWDDKNDLLHVIKLTADFNVRTKFPFILQTINYESIEFIETELDNALLKDTLTKLKNDSLNVDVDKVYATLMKLNSTNY